MGGGHRGGGLLTLGGEVQDERSAVRRVELTAHAAPLLQPVDHVGQSGTLAPELVMQGADRGGSSAVELGEHVRLGLGDVEIGDNGLEMVGDQVRTALDVGHYHLNPFRTILFRMTSRDDVTAAFEAGEISGSEFRHEDHVRVAWELSRRYPREEAYERLAAGIRAMAARSGRPDAFHETITRAWFELIADTPALDDGSELYDRSLLRPLLLGRAARRRSTGVARARSGATGSAGLRVVHRLIC